MHRSETRGLANCADCGAEIEAGTQRGFGFGARGVLCFDCALRRGGSYDAEQDDWTVSPNLDGLDPGEE